MKEFIVTMLAVSLISGFASMLSPEGKAGGLRSFLGFVSGLCALSITVGPIFSFLEGLGEGKGGMLSGYSEDVAVYEYEKIFDRTLAAEGERSLETGLEAILRREFSIKEGDVSADVKLYETEDALEVESVTVTLRGGAILLDAHKLSARVGELLLCECRVVYGGKNGR